jgi:hypothetical protein
VPGMGALLPAGIRPHLRPLALLVPSLLVIESARPPRRRPRFPYRVP